MRSDLIAETDRFALAHEGELISIEAWRERWDCSSGLVQRYVKEYELVSPALEDGEPLYHLRDVEATERSLPRRLEAMEATPGAAIDAKSGNNSH